MENCWISVDEITKYLGVSRDAVYTWISNRALPCHRIGRFWEFKRGEVDRCTTLKQLTRSGTKFEKSGYHP